MNFSQNQHSFTNRNQTTRRQRHQNYQHPSSLFDPVVAEKGQIYSQQSIYDQWIKNDSRKSFDSHAAESRDPNVSSEIDSKIDLLCRKVSQIDPKVKSEPQTCKCRDCDCRSNLESSLLSSQENLELEIVRLGRIVTQKNIQAQEREAEIDALRESVIRTEKMLLKRENELLLLIQDLEEQLHSQQSEIQELTCNCSDLSTELQGLRSQALGMDLSPNTHIEVHTQGSEQADQLREAISRLSEIVAMCQEWNQLMVRTEPSSLPGTAFRVKEELFLRRAHFQRIENWLNSLGCQKSLQNSVTSFFPGPLQEESEVLLLESFCPSSVGREKKNRSSLCRTKTKSKGKSESLLLSTNKSELTKSKGRRAKRAKTQSLTNQNQVFHNGRQETESVYEYSEDKQNICLNKGCMIKKKVPFQCQLFREDAAECEEKYSQSDPLRDSMLLNSSLKSEVRVHSKLEQSADKNLSPKVQTTAEDLELYRIIALQSKTMEELLMGTNSVVGGS